jgi:DMSO reductase anchor subunit
MVGKAKPTSYYGRPVLKPPVWKAEVPWYFFTGGLAGASAVLAEGAALAGTDELARAARRVADLGVPSRFLNMLRVFRPTSPLSMGSWTLASFAPAAIGSWLLHGVDRLPRARRVAGGVAALLGPVMATYTGVLVADTAVPAWHEVGEQLPFLFAASSAASAGAVVSMLVDPAAATPARRLAITGAVAGLVGTEVVKRRAGAGAEAYERGRAARFARAATGLLGAGAATMVVLGRRRAGAVAAGAMVAAGVVCERWAIFAAGSQSADDPAQTIASQEPAASPDAEAPRPRRR